MSPWNNNGYYETQMARQQRFGTFEWQMEQARLQLNQARSRRQQPAGKPVRADGEGEAPRATHDGSRTAFPYRTGSADVDHLPVEPTMPAPPFGWPPRDSNHASGEPGRKLSKRRRRDADLIRTGNERLTQGDLDGAWRAFDSAYTRKSVVAAAAYGLGIIAYLYGELDYAAAMFQHRVQLIPDDADALCYLGLISEQEDDIDYAIETLQEALTIDPSHEAAHRELSRILGHHRPAHA